MEANQINQGNTKSKGIGLFGILTILFVTLKVLSVDPVASWSWWWVLAPLWAPTALILAIGILILIIGSITTTTGHTIETIQRKRLNKKRDKKKK